MTDTELIKRIIINTTNYMKELGLTISIKDYIKQFPFVGSLFIWSETVEGERFWSSVYEERKDLNNTEYFVSILYRYLDEEHDKPFKRIPCIINKETTKEIF